MLNESPKDAARRLSSNAISDGFRPEALHVYTNEAGESLFWRVRAKHPDSGEKWVRPFKRDGDNFVLGEPKFPNGKPLYALHRIVDNPDAVVWLVEGELCADKLNALGLVATTSGGATSAATVNAEPLRGREVCIWRDNDAAGLQYQADWRRILIGLGCTVNSIDVAALALAPTEDCVDWLRAHPEADGAAISALPVSKPSDALTNPVEANDEPRRKIISLEIGEVITRAFPKKEPLLSPWFRRQDLAMVYAERGVGKTFFTLSVAYSIASGGKFLNWEADKPRRVLYIDGEMSGVAIQERLKSLVLTNAPQEPPEGFFRIITPDAQDFAMPDLGTVEGQQEIEPQIKDAELIIIDNLSSLMFSAKENEGEGWMPMAAWALQQRKAGRSVLFVHHAGKSGNQRGSSRREDLLDVSIKLKRPSDYNAEQGARFEVIFEKSRGLVGDECKSIEAALSVDPNGKQVWTFAALEGATYERVIEMKKLGMSNGEIAVELGKDRSTVFRHIKRAEAEGALARGEK